MYVSCTLPKFYTYTLFHQVLNTLFSLRKSCLKFSAYITREHKISNFFSEAFSGMKTNDNCVWTSKHYTDQTSKKLFLVDT